MSPLDEDIATLLETEPRMLALLPELLADLEALGGSPDVLLRLLASCTRPFPHWRVIDLGSGKGALSLAVAERFGCQVLGVDGMRAFVETARQQADLLKLAGRCRFDVGNLRAYVREAEPTTDLVIYAAMGNLLGDPASTVHQLRTLVKPGGFIYIEDCYLGPGVQAPAGYGECLTRPKMLAALESRGDKMLACEACAAERMRAINRENTWNIEQRAHRLKTKHPSWSEHIEAYVTRQKKECEILETCFVDAAWLLQKGTESTD